MQHIWIGFSFFVALLTVLPSAILTTEFEDCGSTATDMIYYIENCTIPPCKVYHGTTAYSSLKFKPTKPTKSLRCELTGKLGPIELPFHGCIVDQCAEGVLIEGDCPLEVDEQIDAQLKFEILPLYPSITLTAIYKLIGDDDEIVTCVTHGITVV
jgi:hypothetical protein